MLFGCGGGGSTSTIDTNESIVAKLSGYLESDKTQKADVVLTDTAGSVICTTKTDDNGFYSLEADLTTSDTYILSSQFTSGDAVIRLNSVFTLEDGAKSKTNFFDKMRNIFLGASGSYVININPLTEVVYQVYLDDVSQDLSVINGKVMAYFGILDNFYIFQNRFTENTQAYKGMHELAAGVNLQQVASWIASDIVKQRNDLRSLLSRGLDLSVSSESVEVGKNIDIEINNIDDRLQIVWKGVDDTNENVKKVSVTQDFPGVKVISLMVLNAGVLIVEKKIELSFYEVHEPVQISVGDGGADITSIVDDFTVTVKGGSAPSSLNSISVSVIDYNSEDVLVAFKMEPSGAIFSEPVIISIPYSIAEIGDPSAYYVERTEEDGTVEILNSEIDYDNSTITVKTDHFSTFRIIKNNGRKLVDTGFWSGGVDIEDDIFFTDDFESFLNYMISFDSPLENAVINNLKQFKSDGWDGLDNLNGDYEKAMAYVLAESSGWGIPMSKYELLVDSIKKYRIAVQIRKYKLASDALTKNTILHKILEIESEKYFMNETPLASSEKAFLNIYDTGSNVSLIKDAYLTYLQYGLSATGSGIALSLLKDFVINEAMTTLQNYTRENIVYLSCFDRSEGTFSLGSEDVLSVDQYGNTKLSYSQSLETITEMLASRNTDYSDLSQRERAFIKCLKDSGSETDAEAARLLYRFTSGKVDFSNYLPVIKALSVGNSSLDDYSERMLTIASVNAAKIIQSIMIEKNLISSGSLDEMRKEDPDFFNAPKVSGEAKVRFNNNYKKERSTKSLLNSDASGIYEVYSPTSFYNIKFAIAENLFANFKLDKVTITGTADALDRKIALNNTYANYYETNNISHDLSYSVENVNSSLYVKNTGSGKYELSLIKLFPQLTLSDPSLANITISAVISYKGKKLYLNKAFSFIADSSPQSMIMAEIEKGGFELAVKNKSGMRLENFTVQIGKYTYTDVDGKLSLDELSPGKYTVSVYKEEYLTSEYVIDVHSGQVSVAEITIYKSGEQDTVGLYKLTKTGQTSCWDSAGTLLDTAACLISGQDGAYQKGVDPDFERDNATNIVTDNLNGLMWQDNAVGSTMTWADAGTTCDNLSLGGYDDWRLPSIDELESIVDFGRVNPAINSVFVNTASFYYWSSTSNVYNTDYAWDVDFNHGNTNAFNKNFNLYARCVRSGQ